ncbi:MAG: DUF1853 family protein [Burkholderiales bacterium]
MTRTIYSRFHHAQVRDLVWVMASPNLLVEADWLIGDRECQNILASAMPALLALDRHPEPLLAWLAARSPNRLGPYFELLVAYWLAFLIDADWYATNKIVKSGRITVGEYDLLWRSASGQLHHWEVSAKLYLQVNRDRGFAGYIGTMKHDRLDFKVARLRDKQLHLAGTPEGAMALPEPGEQIRCRALFKGWLFYPRQGPDFAAAGLSSRHLSGWWAHWHNSEFVLQPNLRWRILERLSWLAPVRCDMISESSAEDGFREELAACFAGHATPLLVAGLAQTGDGWEEVTRGFIVPSAW